MRFVRGTVLEGAHRYQMAVLHRESRRLGQPADIKAQYRSASVLKNRRVVFNIRGNDYRLIVTISYRLQFVYVKLVGTHKEYDAVDAETDEMA